MLRHRIKFRHNDEQDDHCIDLAFSKKKIDQRKEWLTNWMEEGKRRKELGLPEVYLYEKDTRAVTYADFVNKELVRIQLFFLVLFFCIPIIYANLLKNPVTSLKSMYSVSKIVLTFDCLNKLF
jgi:hypothetical protein